jgi:hypothetical protein
MLEPIEGEGFPAMSVSTHQALDKHFREVVEHTCVLQFDQSRRQRIAFCWSHLEHARCIQTLRLKRELPQLDFGKKSVQGDGRPLTGKPLLPLQQIANVGQGRASCILLEFVPSSLPGLRAELCEECIDRTLAFRTDRIGHAPVKRPIHLCPAAFGPFVQCRESWQLETVSDQFLDGYVNDVGQIFHSGRRKPHRCREHHLATLIEALHAEIPADDLYMTPPCTRIVILRQSVGNNKHP